MATLLDSGERENGGVADEDLDDAVSLSANFDQIESNVTDDNAAAVRQGENVDVVTIAKTWLRNTKNPDAGVAEVESSSNGCGKSDGVGHCQSFAGITMEVIDGELVISGARAIIVRAGCDNVVESDTVTIIERDENGKGTAILISSVK